MATFRPGLFGSSAPQIRRLQPAAMNFAPSIEELRAQQEAMMQAGTDSMALSPSRTPRMGAFAQGPQGQTNPAPAPVSSAPSYSAPSTSQGGQSQQKKESNPLLDAFGYNPDKTDMGGLEWWFSSPERRDQGRAEFAGARAAEAEAQRRSQVSTALEQAGFKPHEIAAYFANEGKAAEAIWDGRKQQVLDPGDTLKLGDGSYYTAPNLIEEAKLNRPVIENTGQAIVSIDPTTNKPTVLYRDQPSAAAGGESYRPATPDDLKAWGIPEGVAVKINTRTGEPQVISGARAPSVYTPAEQKTFHGKASALKTLEHLTNTYRDLVNQYGPGLFDSNAKGEKTIEGQKLRAAHNNLMMYLKGPEMFNLGVLTGPDLERLQRTLPEPVGLGAFGQSKETLGVGLQGINDLVNFQMNQIPEEFRSASPEANQPAPSNSVFDALGTFGRGMINGLMPQQPPQGRPMQPARPTQPAADDLDSLVNEWLK